MDIYLGHIYSRQYISKANRQYCIHRSCTNRYKYRLLQQTVARTLVIILLLSFRTASAYQRTTNFIATGYIRKIPTTNHLLHRPQHLDQTTLCKMSSSTSLPPKTEQQERRWMVSPMEQNGKRVPKASIQSVFMTTAFIPVWAITVLPLSILYQTGNILVQQVQKITKGKSSTSQQPALTSVLDSGYVVDPSTIVAHQERTYDIVVLGVTGFTGYLAARHLIKTYGIGQSVKWAIAGRSVTKLNDVKVRLSQEFDPPLDVSQLETIVVDTSIPSTLPKLVAQTRVVATTAGPYTLYGNHVVEFCTKFGTHYVDITGEVDWIKTMICTWQTTAQQTGAKIVPFCGHDSIPWDISAMLLQQKMHEEQNDSVHHMVFYDEMVGGAPGGTFATIMTNIEGKAVKAPRVEFDPFLRLPDGTKSSKVCNADLSMLPRQLIPPQWNALNADIKSSPEKWTTPFVMALVNSQVVRWSYALRSIIGTSHKDTTSHDNTITYSESVVHTNAATAYVNYVGMILFGSMLLNPVTAYIMKQYLLPKPGDGPSMKSMENKRKFFLLYRYASAKDHSCSSPSNATIVSFSSIL
jgi:short subunit dehydrogenase-like uncharacterized protein